MKDHRETEVAPQVYMSSGTSTLAPYYMSDLSVMNGSGNIQGNRKVANYIEFYREVYTCFTGSFERRYVYDGGLDFGYSGNLGSYPPLLHGAFDPPSPNVYNECLSKVLDRIRADIDLSVSLLEAGQTTRMLKSAVKLISYVRKFKPADLRKAYHDFRHGSATGAAKSVGGKWLEFQYGWKPLANDMYQSLEQMYADTSNRRIRVKERASNKRSQTVTWMFGFHGYQYPVSLPSDRNDRCEIACSFAIPPSRLLELSNYTSLNPVSMTWELLPYSFVVDWFLDVGGYLRNLETAMLYGFSFESGYRTEGIHVQTAGGISYSHTQGSGISAMSTTLSASGGLHILRYKRRTPLNSIPYPRPPRVEANLGSERLLNAAALLSQFLKK